MLPLRRPDALRHGPISQTASKLKGNHAFTVRYTDSCPLVPWSIGVDKNGHQSFDVNKVHQKPGGSSRDPPFGFPLHIHKKVPRSLGRPSMTMLHLSLDQAHSVKFLTTSPDLSGSQSRSVWNQTTWSKDFGRRIHLIGQSLRPPLTVTPVLAFFPFPFLARSSLFPSNQQGFHLPQGRCPRGFLC